MMIINFLYKIKPSWLNRYSITAVVVVLLSLAGTYSIVNCVFPGMGIHTLNYATIITVILWLWVVYLIAQKREQ